MATVLVPGSTDGIGRQTALDLIDRGDRDVLYARNDQRADEARAAVSQAARVVVGDLASLAETRAVAEAAAGMGTYDAIIHNAGLGGADDRMVTEVGSSASSKSTCWRRTSLLASSLRPHVLFTSRPAWSGMRAAPGRPPI